jgi:hypothetical protein
MNLSPQQALWILADPRLPAGTRVDCQWPEARWTEFFLLADAHGVLGFVLDNLDRSATSGGPLPTPPAAAIEAARRRWRAQVAKALRVRHCSRQALAALSAVGVPCAILKGIDFADGMYPNPGLRPTRDVDLMTPRTAFPEVRLVLERLGYWARPRKRGVPFSVARQIFFAGKAKHSVGIEWTASMVPHGHTRGIKRTAFEDLAWQPAVGGGVHSTPATRLLLATLHATEAHNFDRLLQVLDIREACRNIVAEAGWEPLDELLSRTGCRRSVELALAVTSRLMPDPYVNEVRQRIPPRTALRIASHLVSRGSVLAAKRPVNYGRRRALRLFVRLAA